MLKAAIGAACLCAATTAAGEPVRLSGKEIRDLVAGTTVAIDAPLGTKLPVRYTRDGELLGEARDLAPYLGTAFDTGRWWINDDELCHRWKHWFDSEPQCLRLRKEGRTIYWRSRDGNDGTAMIVVPAPVTVAAASVLPQQDVQEEGKMRLTAPPAAAPLVPPAPVPVGGEGRVRDPDVMAIAEPRAAPPDPAPDPAPGTSLSAPPDPPAALPLAFMVANVEQDDVLNVRRGPSTDFDVVAALQPGSRGITITGACQSLWCPVRHEATMGWVNRIYLVNEQPLPVTPVSQHDASSADLLPADRSQARPATVADSPEAPRSCLTPAARELLARIEEQFGPVQVISTCRPGAMIAGTGHPSRHASGNAVDFNAGSRKADVVAWLIANHHDGGTMTYADMDHIHVDIGPHFVSLAARSH
jgi:hypothetical protein